ncbi:MAG: type II CRISPR RNA-guided endonuclease Cas9 [Planctomycetota bacterium]
MKMKGDSQAYVLGLDIGVASIGWVRLGMDGSGDPTALLNSGTHTFDAGVEGDVESGRDEARGSPRREARMPRRMHWRRQRRRKKLLRLLQRNILLPQGDISTPKAIHEYLLRIDADLRSRSSFMKDRVSSHVLPYRLRSEALDRKLELFDLGRALYHLAQRRGFLSNRKSLKKDDDEGAVQKGITELQSAMNAAGARTMGQYFGGLDPETDRIRRRWTARSMYIDEFNQILDAQSPHRPDILTDGLRKELFRAIFFQRSLKSARHLIGRCELVPNARRAALGDRSFQEFRIHQIVNNLQIIPPDASPRSLDDQQRAKIIVALAKEGDLTFARIKNKSILGLPKDTELKAWGQDDEKKLPGHRTDQKMRKVFGDRWDQMDETERDAIVLEVLSFQNPEALARRAMKAWGLDGPMAKALADTRLEQGYAAHSRRALRMLVNRMEDGTPYATARRELFPESFEASDPAGRLPPVLKAVPSLRNPAVARALTELRKLVNEIVRVHGKPEQIRVELARDLKRARKVRERISKEFDTQTRLRDQAKARILHESGISEPRRSDIEKALLWDECGGKCPYTGKSIAFGSLFGQHPQFDVEHILPFSRSLDNSFANKTLCFLKENRDHKRNRTPFEAYGQDEARYAEILARVRGFQGKSAAAKLRRFEMREIPEDFVNRQLSDTRYASRLAGDYLALLYGGRTDESGKQRIQISTGGITHHLRNEWQLNSILGDGGEKNRDDHRHHAVDALAIALASPSLVQKLQRAAEHASETGRHLFAPVPEPWPGFLEQAREKVLAINVSTRLTKRIAGDLHEDTNYSKEHQFKSADGKVKSVRHVRKPIDAMNEAQAVEIVDQVVREKVRTWLQIQGKKGKNEPVSFPTIRAHDGREIPIKTARIRKVVTAVPVGDGPRTRYVKPGANHHTVIVKVLGKEGSVKKWQDYPVTRLEAHQRKIERRPIIQREWGDDRGFVMSISRGEHFIIDDEHGIPRLWRCTTVSDGDNWFRLHCAARALLFFL